MHALILGSVDYCNGILYGLPEVHISANCNVLRTPLLDSSLVLHVLVIQLLSYIICIDFLRRPDMKTHAYMNNAAAWLQRPLKKTLGDRSFYCCSTSALEQITKVYIYIYIYI